MSPIQRACLSREGLCYFSSRPTSCMSCRGKFSVFPSIRDDFVLLDPSFSMFRPRMKLVPQRFWVTTSFQYTVPFLSFSRNWRNLLERSSPVEDTKILGEGLDGKFLSEFWSQFSSIVLLQFRKALVLEVYPWLSLLWIDNPWLRCFSKFIMNR